MHLKIEQIIQFQDDLMKNLMKKTKKTGVYSSFIFLNFSKVS